MVPEGMAGVTARGAGRFGMTNTAGCRESWRSYRGPGRPGHTRALEQCTNACVWRRGSRRCSRPAAAHAETFLTSRYTGPLLPEF